MRLRKYSKKKGSLNWVLDKYSRNKQGLTVKKMDRDTVLIEGSAKALRFLGEVLIAHAKEWDCKFHLDPKGGGSAWFKKGSTLGLYLHRLPCYWKKRRAKRTTSAGRSG